MRVSFFERTPSLNVKHSSFDYVSKIFLSTQRYSDSTITLNMNRAAHGDGNMTAVLVAVGFKLKKINSQLDIGPRRHGYNKVRIENTLFGHQCTSFAFDRLAYYSDATGPKIIENNDSIGFGQYLIEHAIRKDWRSNIPVYQAREVKGYLRKLFENVAEHSYNGSPVFISSSFKKGILTFTVADCGVGILKHVAKFNDEVVIDKQAIDWIFRGNRTKIAHRGHKGTLQALGDYCKGNGGYLHVVSGNASVEYKPKGKYGYERLSSSFTGTIITFGVKVKRQKFE